MIIDCNGIKPFPCSFHNMESVKYAAIAYGVGAATTKALGLVLQAKAVPALMAATGKVVSGVGTIHAAGGVTAITQSVACALMTTPVALGGGAVALAALGAYAALSKMKPAKRVAKLSS